MKMVAFDNIEDIFQQIRAFNDNSRAAVTLVTAIGALYVTYALIKLSYRIIIASRLYVCSQLWHTNFVAKYGKWALISGATDGVGLAMAKEMARRGHSIMIIGRSHEKLADSKNLVQAENDTIEVVTVKIDLSDPSIENFESIRSAIDPDNRDIGILINNAGISHPYMKHFHKIPSEDMMSVVNVNVMAVLHLTKMIIPSMLNRGRGLVINVSSTAGLIPCPFMGVYGCTKSFINAFSKNLQFEYKNQPIDIINLTPGVIQTKLFRNVYDHKSMHKSSLIAPLPESYAKSALNACSTNHHSFCGCIGHAVTLKLINLFQAMNLYRFCLQLSFSTSSKYEDMSPVSTRAQRKRSQRNDETGNNQVSTSLNNSTTQTTNLN